MRQIVYRNCLSVMLLGGLLGAVVVSCQSGMDDSAAQEGISSDPSAVEQSALSAVSDTTRAPGLKLDRQQAAQLLGDRLPAAVGEPCTDLVADCAPVGYAPIGTCGGFSDTCDSTGTQSATPVHYRCLSNGSQTVCTAVADQTTVSIACSRQTNGISCGAARCDSPFCLAYASTCAEQATQVQNCFSARTCMNGICSNPTMTQSPVGTCQRNTDGKSCTAGRTCDGGACVGCAAGKVDCCGDGNCVPAGACGHIFCGG